MAKPDHKQHKHHQQAASQPVDPSQQAAAELAAGRFRKARDLYKILCKEDRPKYLPKLIEANRGLITQLLEKGQVSEAEQVMAYLKTIMPASEVLGIAISGALKKQDWAQAFRDAVALWDATGGAPEPGDKQAIADALVLAFPHSLSAEEALKFKGLSVPPALEADLLALDRAFHCISERKFEDAQQSLRPIPRLSLFADWRLLAKGMIAFYSGEKKKAQDTFDMLSPSGAPSRAASAYRLFLSAVQNLSPDDKERAAQSASALAGLQDLGSTLVKADRLWRSKEYSQSYMMMRSLAAFPSEDLNVWGVLSDFYFQAFNTLGEDVQPRYVYSFFALHTKDKLKNLAEKRLVYRHVARDALAFDPEDIAERLFRKFIATLPADEPRTKKLASIVLWKLGECQLMSDDEDPSYTGNLEVRAETRESAIRNLKESIQYNPKNLDAQLTLLKLYQSQRMKSDCTQLLNEMVKNFPKEKAVLFEAGCAAVERKSYQKGIANLEEALALDPLDAAVKFNLASAYLAAAQQHYTKGNEAKAREIGKRCVALANRTSWDLKLGYDILLARCAAVEAAFGALPMATAQLKEAIAVSHCPPATILYGHMYHSIITKKSLLDLVFLPELKKTPVIGPTARKRVYETFQFWRNQADGIRILSPLEVVHTALAPLLTDQFERDEAAYYVEMFEDDDCFDRLRADLIKAGLKHDRKDNLFMLFAEIDKLRKTKNDDISKVQALRKAAHKEGDHKTVALADSFISLWTDGDDDDFDDDDDDGPDFHVLPPTHAHEKNPDFTREMFEELRERVKMMSDTEYEALRKMCGKMMPLPIFDLMVGSARPNARKPRRDDMDDSQLDLFGLF